MSNAREPGKEAGKEALSYCTSCKMDLNHIIVAMKGDQIAKVECQTCKKIHVYRAPKGITEPPVKKATKKAQAAAEAKIAEAENAKQTLAAEWERLISAQKNPTKPYSLKAAFNLGDKIGHPSFGEGVVNKLLHPDKIEVIFKTDIKILKHLGMPQA